MKQKPDNPGLLNPLEELFRSLLGTDSPAELRCTRRELEDVMAVVFLQSYRQVPLSSLDTDALLADFFARVGLESEDQLGALDGLLQAYFAKHPLRQDILKAVVQELGQREQIPSVRAGYAGSGAF